MCMKLNWKLCTFLQSLYKLCCLVWYKKSSHILDTDRICTHLLNLSCHVLPIIHCISITKCIRKCNLCMSIFLVCCLYSCLKVTDIIQTVKDTNDINTICDTLLYEILYNIIRIWAVSKDILSTEQHLKLCILESITELTKSVPWILFQETETSVECSTTPALYGMVTNFIHFINNWQHLLCCHTSCNQRLVCISQHSFGNLYRFLFFCH